MLGRRRYRRGQQLWLDVNAASHTVAASGMHPNAADEPTAVQAACRRIWLVLIGEELPITLVPAGSIRHGILVNDDAEARCRVSTPRRA